MSDHCIVHNKCHIDSVELSNAIEWLSLARAPIEHAALQWIFLNRQGPIVANEYMCTARETVVVVAFALYQYAAITNTIVEFIHATRVQ